MLFLDHLRFGAVPLCDTLLSLVFSPSKCVQVRSRNAKGMGGPFELSESKCKKSKKEACLHIGTREKYVSKPIEQHVACVL